MEDKKAKKNGQEWARGVRGLGKSVNTEKEKESFKKEARSAC